MDPDTTPHTSGICPVNDFQFECGRKLEQVDLFYETWGTLNAKGTNAALVEHSLTGTSHAASGTENPEEGWWEWLIGPGKALDTDKYFVICSNVPGGCSGSTGPSSTDPLTGKPYGASFPAVTIRDMVHAQKRLIDHLQVKKLVTVTGGSMGGMQAMEWAAMYPEYVESIIPLAAPGRAYPQSIAFRKAQRKAIINDPDWNGGNYYGSAIPAKGIELARLIGFITYRTDREFTVRFGRQTENGRYFDLDGRFEIEKYLEYQGRKLAEWFDANTYLYLSKSMDLHDLGYGSDTYGEGVRRIQAKTLIIGLRTDILFPTDQQKEVVSILRETNPAVLYREVETLFGHDAFLLEEEQISGFIRAFLAEITEEKETLHALSNENSPLGISA